MTFLIPSATTCRLAATMLAGVFVISGCGSDQGSVKVPKDAMKAVTAPPPSKEGEPKVDSTNTDPNVSMPVRNNKPGR